MVFVDGFAVLGNIEAQAQAGQGVADLLDLAPTSLRKRWTTFAQTPGPLTLVNSATPGARPRDPSGCGAWCSGELQRSALSA